LTTLRIWRSLFSLCWLRCRPALARWTRILWIGSTRWAKRL